LRLRRVRDRLVVAAGNAPTGTEELIAARTAEAVSLAASGELTGRLEGRPTTRTSQTAGELADAHRTRLLVADPTDPNIFQTIVRSGG
jgi:hypothetical protein